MTTGGSMKKLKYLLLAILLIAFDQFTKYLAIIKLKNKPAYELIPGVFEFHYHENNGAVWGIFGGKTIFLLIFTTLILAVILYVYYKIPEHKKFVALHIIAACIIAGAIGNLIDRFRFQYVVDFLYFKLIDFPIFNVADCYITVSATLLLILSFFYYKDEDFDFLSKKKSAAKVDTNQSEEIINSEEHK